MVNRVLIFCTVLSVIAFTRVQSDQGDDGRYEVLESNIDHIKNMKEFLEMMYPKHSKERTPSVETSIKRHEHLEIEGDPISHDSSDSYLNEILPSSLGTTPSTQSTNDKAIDKIVPRIFSVEIKPAETQPETTKTPNNYADKASIEKQISQISLQNPEYRMVGPNRTEELLMGDDVGSTLLAALDNMQLEAKELWGQVSETVEDKWNQLKKAVEQQLESATKEKQNTYATRRLQSTSDIGLDIPSSVDPGAVTDTKANTFLNNIGISTETQKKASELISNAGTSIKEVAQKDLPVAYEKAKTSVSEAITKDIPNYWNKLFGSNKSN